MEKKMIKWILAILMILISIILVICINKYQKNGFKKIATIKLINYTI